VDSTDTCQCKEWQISPVPLECGKWDTSGNPVAPRAAAATGESNTLNKMGNKEYLWGQCKTDSDLKRIKLLSSQKVAKKNNF
jgi:hypothetical protein